MESENETDSVRYYMLNGRDPKAAGANYGNKYPAAYHMFKWSLVLFS
ncbi:MAG: hypothetical protein WBZ36_22850 [Candidatus Nitrosopolaris sp.]